MIIEGIIYNLFKNNKILKTDYFIMNDKMTDVELKEKIMQYYIKKRFMDVDENSIHVDIIMSTTFYENESYDDIVMIMELDKRNLCEVISEYEYNNMYNFKEMYNALCDIEK